MTDPIATAALAAGNEPLAPSDARDDGSLTDAFVAGGRIAP